MGQKSSKLKVNGGTYTFKLEELLAKHNISKNKLVKDTGTDFKVINRLAQGDVMRIDIYVLARLCDYLKCDVEDIVEFKRDSR